MTTKPRRKTFEVAVADAPHRATRTGYVLGNWAAHKEGYFYTFTYLPTGCSVNVWPCHETVKAACAHLEALNAGTAEQCATVKTYLERYGSSWGMGMCK